MGESWKMTDYNLDRIDIIENYIRNPTVDFFYDHVVNIQDNIVLVVNWREVDEAIIRYCENILQTGSLSAQESTEKSDQYELTLFFKDQVLQVPYKNGLANRDATLIALNQILKPEYEIRFCRASDGNDTLIFLPLPKATWRALTKQYPEQIKKLFETVTKKSKFFSKPCDFEISTEFEIHLWLGETDWSEQEYWAYFVESEQGIPFCQETGLSNVPKHNMQHYWSYDSDGLDFILGKTPESRLYPEMKAACLAKGIRYANSMFCLWGLDGRQFDENKTYHGMTYIGKFTDNSI